MRIKIEKTVHPRPCATCGRAAEWTVNGRRACVFCLHDLRKAAKQ